MATRRVNDLLQHLRQHVLLPEGNTLSDGQLLERFLTQRDEAAFETLLRRHGPMVLAVCRRVLRDAHDAEDAFQATFLVLVRKAGSIVPRQQVGNWLYGVAYRTALEARTLARRRRVKEQQAARIGETRHADKEPDLDFRPLLDRELSRLPAKYRSAIVLCDLEDKTHKEAARILGWPEGTLSTRLLRGRALLAKRLIRYGLAIGGVLTAHSSRARAVVPAPLTLATRAAARHIAFGTAAEAISPAVTQLLEGVMRTMWIAKIKLATAAVLALFALGTGTGLLFYSGSPAAEVETPQQKRAQSDGPKARDTELENLKNEYVKLHREYQALRMELDDLKKASGTASEKGKDSVLYGGKPASFWIKQLKDRKPEFRAEAVTALGCIAEEDKSVIPIVIGTLKDRSSKVHSAVQDAVWNGMGANGKAAIPLLIDAMKDRKSPGRLVVPGTLLPGWTKDQTVVAAVVKAARSDDIDLASNALRILANWDLPAALPVLVEALKDKASPLNQVALEYYNVVAAGRGGGPRMARRPGVGFRIGNPQLQQLLSDKDPRVRRQAEEVMKLLQEEAEPKADSAPIR